jgi:hypothetical protein
MYMSSPTSFEQIYEKDNLATGRGQAKDQVPCNISPKTPYLQ